MCDLFLNVTCEVDFVKTTRDFVMDVRVVGKPLLLVKYVRVVVRPSVN